MAETNLAPVYGGDLCALCEHHEVLIPPFISQFMKYIEEFGKDVEGIYRLSGSKKGCTAIKWEIEGASGTEIDLTDIGVHNVATCLKEYFRELFQPLIPFDMFNDFIQAAKSPEETRAQKIETLLKGIPLIHYYTCYQLIQHLKRIAANSDVNKMHPKNISIVFGPTLLRPEDMSDPLKAAQFVTFQNTVVETMLTESEAIFPEQESVFGCDLHDLYTRQEGIPNFLTYFMDHIETEGANKAGLYIGSGKTTKKDQLRINMLKLKVELEDYELSKYSWASIFVVGSCIKEFFRKLPEPVIPYSMYSSFIIAAKSLHTQRMQNIAILVKELPEINYNVLKSLIQHLATVCSLSKMKEMTPLNVGHVFGMLVMRPEGEMTVELMKSLPYQNRIVEVMVSNYETVFHCAPPRRILVARRQGTVISPNIDPVFGTDLAILCKRDDVEVPKFFTLLVEYIENDYVGKVGLYKRPCNPAAVKILKGIINKGESIDLNSASWMDAYVAANTLKLYLQELPESLIPRNMHQSFIEVAKLKSLEEKLNEYATLLWDIPDAHHQVLSYFLRHLKTIVLNKKANKSSAANMGILFGSVIMRSPDDSSKKKITSLQNSVVEVLVRNYADVFNRRFLVFGSELVALCKQERRTVPAFLTLLIQRIETMGLLQEVGVYRLSGTNSVVEQIVELIDAGEDIDFEEPAFMRLGNLTGVIKRYFRDLPSPLIPLEASQDLVLSLNCIIHSVRTEKFASILKNIPECNYCTLKTMMEHLLNVVSFSSINRMNALNLSIIFGPTLMRPNFIVGTNLFSYTNVIRFMIDTWEEISHICDKYRYSPVFGWELSEVCAREHRTIPKFFRQSVQLIEKKGLRNRDIYITLRAASAIASINKLKNRIDQGKNLDKIEPWMTQQVVASCLKLYLKELPEPLIPYNLFDAFILVIKRNKEQVERIEQLSNNVKKLDFARYHTLKLFMGHLKRLTDKSDVNGAKVHLISMMFGQTVMKPDPAKVSEVNLQFVMFQNAIVKTMITEYDHIFA